MHAGTPIFWRATFQRMGVDLGAVRRTAGLEMALGNVALARIMGPDSAIANPLGESHSVLVCEQCASRQTSVYELGFAPEDR